MQQKQSQEKAQEGQDLASQLALQGESYRSAVEKGLIPEHGNPFFVAGVKEQFGRVMADKMGEAFREHMKTNPEMLQSTDPADFDKNVQWFQEEWMGANIPPDKKDRFFNTGFASRAVAQMQANREQFDGIVANNLSNLSIASLHEETANHIANSWGKVSVEESAADLATLRSDMVAQGRSPIQVDRTMYQAILATAKREKNLDMLHLADLIKGRDGTSLAHHEGDASETELLKARDYITGSLRSDAENERVAKNTKDQERTDAAFGEAFTRLLQNPSAAIVDLADSVKDIGNGAASAAVLRARDMVQSATQFDDPTVERQLFTKIWGEGTGTARDVMTAFNRGGLSIQRAQQLIDYIKARDANNRQGALLERQAVAAEAQAAAAQQQAYNQIVNDPLLSDELNALPNRFPKGAMGQIDPSVGDAIQYARASLKRAYFNYIQTPEGAAARLVPGAMTKWLSEQAAAVSSQYRGQTLTGSILPSTAKPDSTPESPKAIISPDDLASYYRGQPSETLKLYFSQLKLFSADAKTAWIKRQQQLLLKNTKNTK
jgi:hypothetical protein